MSLQINRVEINRLQQIIWKALSFTVYSPEAQKPAASCESTHRSVRDMRRREETDVFVTVNTQMELECE